MVDFIKTIKSQNEEIEKRIKELPLEHRLKALAIYHYTLKKQSLDEELEVTIRGLQKEQDQMALPLYELQSQIIMGERAATSEELVNLDLYFGESECALKEELRGNRDPLVGYWGRALEKCEEIQMRFNSEGANEKDSEVLKHLKRIQLEMSQESNDFTLVFHFEQNEHFTNTELRKKFFFAEKVAGNDDEDTDFPTKSESTEINWKEGKNITKKVVQKVVKAIIIHYKQKQKNKKTGASRNVNKTVDCESFFNFFRSVSLEAKDNLDDEAAEELELKMENDFEVGRTIQDEVVPYSLEYFLGINPENEDDECDDEDCDEDHHGHDHDDGSNDSDEDHDNKKNSKKNKRKASGDSKKSNDKTDKAAKPDCKQQ